MKNAVFAFIFLTVIAIAGNATAIPAFSKKYEAPCSLCHTVWPKLNTEGFRFKLNGFQLPNSEDGGETSKFAPSDSLFLDIGNASPPISVMLEGGVTVIQPGSGPENDQQDNIFCCVTGNTITAMMGGTIGPNIGYYFALPWGKQDANQAYLRFVNAFSPGLASVDLGVMKVVDNDVVPHDRNFIGASSIALLGHPYNNNGNQVGMTAAGYDTGARIYGQPGYGKFYYEVGFFTGNQITGAAENDSSLAYTFMGRLDLAQLSFSLRYWTNTTGVADQTLISGDGTSVTFPANAFSSDENLLEFYLSAQYRHPSFEIDVALDRTASDISDRSFDDSDGTTRTYSRNTINRLGVSVEATWLVNNWFRTGLSYGYTTFDDYTTTADGVEYTTKGVSTGLVQWRMEMAPVTNMKLGLELQIDTSSADSRILADGSEHDAQHKVVLQWDLAI